MKINSSISNFNMKTFIIKTVWFLLPILILVTSVNYFGDAARLFSKNYENKIAEILASGKLVTNISNYDERVLQKEIITKNNLNPDILVLGSSRTLLIEQSFLSTHSTMYNSSVSGASIEDLIAIFQMYKEQNIIPTKVIIGIDPWFFNENNEQKRWESVEEYYYSFIGGEQKKGKKDKFKKYKELFSLSYFQSSLKEIPNVLSGKSMPISTDSKENETTTKLLDGAIKYGNEHRLASAASIQSKVNWYKNNQPMYSLGKDEELSPNLLRLFTLLVEDIKKQNIDIVFFLAPYHPEAYEVIEVDYPSVLAAEAFIKKYAIQESLPLIGSFNPKNFDLDKHFFYDGMHCNEAGVKKILEGFDFEKFELKE